MIHDPKTPLPFKPDGDGPVTYLLRVPTVADRSEFQRQLRLAGARFWSLGDIVESAKAAVKRLSREENAEERDTCLALLDAWLEEVRAAAQAWDDDRTEANREAFEEAITPKGNVKAILDVLCNPDPETQQIADPTTAERLADLDVFAERQGLVAARMFLVGWEGMENAEGEPVPFKRSLLGLGDDMLALIPRHHLLFLGRQVRDLIQAPGARLGNSSSASGGRSSQPSSPSPKARRPSVRSTTATSTTAPGSAAAESA